MALKFGSYSRHHKNVGIIWYIQKHYQNLVWTKLQMWCLLFVYKLTCLWYPCIYSNLTHIHFPTCLCWTGGLEYCEMIFSLRWRHNDHDSVSDHQPHGWLLNCLFRRRSKKTSKLRVTGLCVGNSPGPVNSPHKWPVTRKMFPFDDVIMFPLSVGRWLVFPPILCCFVYM